MLCFRPKLLAGKQDTEMKPSIRTVLDTINEKAGSPTVVVVKMHDYATLEKAANSVDKIVDKDPKKQHEDTVKSKEGNLEEAIAGLNSRLSSYEKQILKLALSSNVEAQPAILLKASIETLNAQKQLINAMQQQINAMQQEKNAKQQDINAKLQEINATKQQINAMQQEMDVSMRLRVQVSL
jgi:chromosome segregation ATPase